MKMRFFSLMLTSCFAFGFSTTQPENLTLTFKGSPQWTLDDAARKSFDSFLETQRHWLLEKLPNLAFPAEYASFQDAFKKYAYAGDSDFLNRAIACSFLDKLQQALSDVRSQNILRALRRGDRVCIPADLKDEERAEWTLALIELIWNGHWINNGQGRKLSLEEHLISALDLKEYQPPTFRILEIINLDGYGYNYNKVDLHFISQNPIVARLYDLTSGYDVNRAESLGDFGAEFNQAVKKDPTSLGGFFITRPTIYLSKNWDPASLVELLAHEYGHVYHGGKGAALLQSLQQNELTIRGGDNIHGEGFAEAFAWNGLKDLYDAYPEIKYFHVLKLHLMSQQRPNDNHYVGAAAFASAFHSDDSFSQEDLFRFSTVSTLAEFMESFNLNTLAPKPAKEDTSYRLNWGK